MIYDAVEVIPWVLHKVEQVHPWMIEGWVLFRTLFIGIERRPERVGYSYTLLISRVKENA